MIWAQLRGFLAFLAVVGAIAYAWTTIEGRETDVSADADTTTSTIITTTSTAPSTTTPEQAVVAMCGRAELFVAQSQLIPVDSGPGPLAMLALEFWRDVSEVAVPEVAVEVVAIIDYYETYLATAEQFDFNTVQIILEGDKEKFEQLVTRPAPGLGGLQGAILFLCEVELPGQPSISAASFDALEDRLFDPPDD